MSNGAYCTMLTKNLKEMHFPAAGTVGSAAEEM
ncbi:hypothetical protein FOIG_16841 [Fusarium odoratissimum NRRL 54006]|uniref:Uncharacterized protein n=1 Tax=Fusarium odoratissimum (strain NRRL 54006) TaxID=1089451 RepID=X0J0K6_FUSO5|nr:uncharacterized protein FOIG_16841 [Fusarium odoratissimum NRRL 54006]EXL89876.1 hypothetical protein FOIG_16841 [Fusarium odoratissimum NRRL 54006]